MEELKNTLKINAGRIASAYISRNSALTTKELTKRSVEIAIELDNEVENQLKRIIAESRKQMGL